MSLLRRLRLIMKHLHGEVLDREDLIRLLEHSFQRGILPPDVHRLCQKVFRSRQKTIGEIMVPRVDMVTVPETATLEEALAVFRKTGFSKMPVIRDRVDHITGILHIKELVRNLDKKDVKTVKDIALNPVFFPENKNVLETLQEFQRRRLSIGIVVDEFGSVLGLITLEDLLEEIVGEIWEEFDRMETLYEIQPDGSILFQTKIELEEASEILGIPLNGEDVATLGGWIMAHLNRVPAEGETFEIQGLEFTVIEATPQRLKRVLVRRPPKAASHGGVSPGGHKAGV